MRSSSALFVVAVAATSCGVVPIDVDGAIAEQHVPGDPNPLAPLLPTFLQVPLTIDIQSATQKQNTGPAHSATLKSLSLSSTPHATPSGNFDFLDEIHVYISAPSSSALGKPEIASLAPVPKGQTTLNFNVISSVDLLPFINAGAQISSTASGHSPQKDFSYDGKVTVTVHF